MNYETIRDSVVSILGAAESTNFQTVGFQRQSKSSHEAHARPFVQVFYSRGTFPTQSGILNGPYKHDATFQIDFTVAQPAKVDLATLNNDSASAAAKTVALAAQQEASYLADRKLDEIFRRVFQILMLPENINLGLAPAIVTDRYINNFQKDQPVPNGELVILTGACLLTCKTTEIAEGAALDVIATPTVTQEINTLDIETESEEDDISQTLLEI